MGKHGGIGGVLQRKASRTHIYIAGPVGKPEDHEDNLKTALGVATALRNLGLVPFVPHLFIEWEKRFPSEYEDWMTLDLAWLLRCDALLRFPGHSPGADREVDYAHAHHIPVFFGLTGLVLWARK